MTLSDLLRLRLTLFDKDCAITGEEIQNGFFYRFVKDTSECKGISTDLATVKVTFPGNVFVATDYIGLVINNDEFPGFFQTAIDHPLQEDLLF